MAESKHSIIERSVPLMIVLTLLAASVGGLVEIVPLFFQKSTTTAIDDKGGQLDIKPYDAVRLAGRDIYIREGCYNCHSQMIRPFRAETERYGHYSVAGEFIYDHPFQWGSKRTGPDLARVGGRYSDQWHRAHLTDPRSVVPESNMPPFAFLDRPLKDDVATKMRKLTLVGVPYTETDIQEANSKLQGLTEMDALIAYLQELGTAITNGRVSMPARIYFDTGAVALPKDANAALRIALDYLGDNPAAKIAITGYTDKTGNVEANLEIAKGRAVAVRDALVAKGIDTSRIVMKPPLEITGSGENSEARRVEINPAS